MICHDWYFADGFKYQPHVCNGYHDFNMIVQNLSDYFIVTVKNVAIGTILWVLIKKRAISLLNNSVLNNKGVL